MDCGDMGRYAHVDNLLSQSARFYLEQNQAKAVISEMEQKMKRTWYETARREGVTDKDCEKFSSAFVYPGFRLAI